MFLLISKPIFIVIDGFLDYSNKIKFRNTVDYKNKWKNGTTFRCHLGTNVK